MLDDLNTGFLPCPENLAPRPLAQPTFINGGVERLPERQSLDRNEIDVSPKVCILLFSLILSSAKDIRRSYTKSPNILSFEKTR